MSASEYEVPCPMPGCDEPLHLMWFQSYGLLPQMLAEHLQPSKIEPESADAQTWQIECTAGHVLLLPGDPRCHCEDGEGTGACDHDVDWSEDFREFRAADLDRLKAVLAALGGAS